MFISQHLAADNNEYMHHEFPNLLAHRNHMISEMNHNWIT